MKFFYERVSQNNIVFLKLKYEYYFYTLGQIKQQVKSYLIKTQLV